MTLSKKSKVKSQKVMTFKKTWKSKVRVMTFDFLVTFDFMTLVMPTPACSRHSSIPAAYCGLGHFGSWLARRGWLILGSDCLFLRRRRLLRRSVSDPFFALLLLAPWNVPLGCFIGEIPTAVIALEVIVSFLLEWKLAYYMSISRFNRPLLLLLMTIVRLLLLLLSWLTVGSTVVAAVVIVMTTTSVIIVDAFRRANTLNEVFVLLTPQVLFFRRTELLCIGGLADWSIFHEIWRIRMKHIDNDWRPSTSRV